MDREQLIWRKSSRSGTNGGNCVEVAVTTSAVAVRDSKDPAAPILAVSPADWRTFMASLR